MLRRVMNRIHLALLVPSVLFLIVACGGSDPPPPQAAPVAAPPPAADYYTGHWRGLAQINSTLPNAPSQMDVSVTIVNDAAQCGSFEYGALGCSGVWTCNSAYSDQVMELTETVRYGGERCPNGARVQLRATNDPDQIELFYENTGISAHGTLQRNDVQY